MPDATDLKARALATVKAFWAAYDAGNVEFFSFFTADACIYPLSSPAPLRGPDAYQRFFGPELTAEARATQILHPEVLPVGEGALVTSQNRIRASYRNFDSRLTLLLIPAGDRLKVAHLHMSPLIVPPAPDPRGLVEDVAVPWALQEKP
jgi:ketosteroid isomerase-like protein